MRIFLNNKIGTLLTQIQKLQTRFLECISAIESGISTDLDDTHSVCVHSVVVEGLLMIIYLYIVAF